MNIHSIKYAYLVGIKGVAMAGMACMLKDMDVVLRGSDVSEEFITDELLKRKEIVYDIGFSTDNINSFLINKPIEHTLVITTGAHGGLENPQCVFAKENGYEVVTHAQALEMLCENKKVISVAGTHGKTTTSSMIAFVSEKAGVQYSYTVGTGSISGLSYPAVWNKKSLYVVLEADEYFADCKHLKIPRFLFQKPHIAVITSIEYDHPDVYKNVQEVEKAFVKFIKNVDREGTIVMYGDNDIFNTYRFRRSAVRGVKRRIKYGFNKSNEAVITDYSISGHKQKFSIRIKGKFLGTFTLSIYGKHNVLNATAAILALLGSGLDVATIRKYLSQFKGSGRRFEFVKKQNGILLYDDYAHHPTEIENTLTGIKSWFPTSKIGVVFQPHMYSRTKALLEEFSFCFSKADYVGITPLFASARESKPIEQIEKRLASAIYKNGKESYFNDNSEKVYTFIKSKLTAGDICLTMGAGDVYKLHSKKNL
jgi:UDP-N-acetylmuramate--alanine ligase